MNDEHRTKVSKNLVNYLYRHFGMHSSYSYKYFFCELLCLFNLVVQILMTDWFLDNQFIPYGVNVLQRVDTLSRFMPKANSTSSMFAPTIDKSVSPFQYIFPRMTKCTFHSFGTSGDVQKNDALCLLPLNVFNEKIYLFLWFWWSILLFLTVFINFVRLVTIVGFTIRAYILKSRLKYSSLRCLKIICHQGNIGDFFLLYQMSQNIDQLFMRDIVSELARKLSKRDDYYRINQNNEFANSFVPLSNNIVPMNSSKATTYIPNSKYPGTQYRTTSLNQIDGLNKMKYHAI